MKRNCLKFVEPQIVIQREENFLFFKTIISCAEYEQILRKKERKNVEYKFLQDFKSFFRLKIKNPQIYINKIDTYSQNTEIR